MTGRCQAGGLVLMAAGCLLAHAVTAREETSLLQDLDLRLHGFIDGRLGVRTQTDPYADEVSLGEVRLQLDAEHMGRNATLRLRSDFVVDSVPSSHDIDLEDGQGWIDTREAYIALYPFRFMDLKLGRQILTWGTGDLLFINDMFPKDWQSFFSGRDVEYLKAPSDTLFASLFFNLGNIDVAYTPRFDADRYIRGDRLSYWSPMLGRRAGDDARIVPEQRDAWFDEDEWAVRAYRTLGGYELAAYFYDGYWKTPRGMNPATRRAFFPRLAVYGASLRGRLGRGIANIETGYYDSKDDPDGTAPFIPNDEVRALAGYERELMQNLSAGLQYYIEHMVDHDAYAASLPNGVPPADENRQVVTLRLTKQALQQTLTLSLFTYYSPTDHDLYLRPVIKYKATDNWLLTVGGNVFAGKEEHTFFGQFEDNNNIYAGARYSF